MLACVLERGARVYRYTTGRLGTYMCTACALHLRPPPPCAGDETSTIASSLALLRLSGGGVDKGLTLCAWLFHATLLGDDALTLPDTCPVGWPTRRGGTPSRTLYVRRCYLALYDKLWALWEDPEEGNAVLLLGTPGVGKSAFALYAAYRLISEALASSAVAETAGATATAPALVSVATRAGAALYGDFGAAAAAAACRKHPKYVIYRPQECDTIVVFDIALRRVTRLELSRVRLPDDETVVELFDAAAPPNAATSGRRGLLISSPRKLVWSDWKKTSGAATLYAPIFSLEEVLRCRTLCFAELSEDIVRALFDSWGGTARTCLTMGNASKQARYLADVVSSLGVADLAHVVRSVVNKDAGSDGAAPHSLLHLDLSPQLDDAVVVFASRYTCDLVLREYAQRSARELCLWIAGAEGNSTLSPVRGKLVERIALAALFSRWAPPLTLQRMGASIDSPDGTVRVDRTERPEYIFDTVEVLTGVWLSNPLAVGVPRSSSWPTWDAITFDGGGVGGGSDTITLWKITVSTPHNHGIVQSGLSKLAPIIPDGADVRFVWVMPKGRGVPTTSSPVPVSASRSTRPLRPGVWQSGMVQYELYLDIDIAEVTAAGVDAGAFIADHDADVAALLPSVIFSAASATAASSASEGGGGMSREPVAQARKRRRLGRSST